MIERITTEYPDFDDLKYTVNQLVDAVNELKESQYIYKKSSITRAKNVQSDVKTRPVTVSELAYLQKENSDLKDELERTRKALEIAVDALRTVRRYTAINQFAPKSREAHIVAKKAVAEITALEQKD